MKNSLWIIIALVTGIVGFLMGYSVSSYTGTRSVAEMAAHGAPPAAADSGPAQPVGHGGSEEQAKPVAGGYGGSEEKAKPAAGGYGGSEEKAEPAAGGYGAAAPAKPAKPAKKASAPPASSKPVVPAAGY